MRTDVLHDIISRQLNETKLSSNREKEFEKRMLSFSERMMYFEHRMSNFEKIFLDGFSINPNDLVVPTADNEVLMTMDSNTGKITVKDKNIFGFNGSHYHKIKKIIGADMNKSYPTINLNVENIRDREMIPCFMRRAQYNSSSILDFIYVTEIRDANYKLQFVFEIDDHLYKIESGVEVIYYLLTEDGRLGSTEKRINLFEYELVAVEPEDVADFYCTDIDKKIAWSKEQIKESRRAIFTLKKNKKNVKNTIRKLRKKDGN